MIDAEFKGIVEDLVNKFVSVLEIGTLTDTINKNLRESYVKGLDEIGVQLNMNFTGFPERFDLLSKYTFENIKDLREETANNLRKELSQSLLNIESVSQMQERVVKVMEVTTNRARMIARTEMNRAENMGHIDGARQSGVKFNKKWHSNIDSRTSPICRHLNGQIIPIDEKFVYEGKEYDIPPAHVNCRSTILFIRDKGEKSFSELIDYELKFKYIKRTGGPGNYTYWYKDPRTGQLTTTPPKRSFKRRTSNNLLTMNSRELSNELKSRVEQGKMNTIKENVKLFKQGKDSMNKYYDKKTNIWNPERQKQHNKIVAKYDEAAKQAISKGKPEVLFLSGLPASGKTFLTKKMYKPVDGSNILKEKDGKKYIVLNADDIKEQFKNEYDNGNGATLLHNESSYLNSELVKKYSDANINIIIDGTLAKTDKAREQLNGFKDKGYGSSLIYVDVPVNQAIINSMNRTREEGRYVSPDIIIDYNKKIKNSVDVLEKHFDNFQHIKVSMPEEMLVSNYNYAMGGDK